MRNLFSPTHRAVFILNLFLTLVTGIVVYKLKSRIDLGSPVLVVPVQIGGQKEGVPGLLTLAMPREQAVSNLGLPRIARKPGFDGEPLLELTSKIFAWVGFDENDAVDSIEFDLAESRHEYAGQQQIALLYDGSQYLLKRGMSVDEVRQLFDHSPAGMLTSNQQKRKSVIFTMQVFVPSDTVRLEIKNTGMSLNFYRDSLTTVTIRKRIPDRSLVIPYTPRPSGMVPEPVP
jgi:hypothetical protein